MHGIDDEVICQRCFDSFYLKDSKCYKCPQNCGFCKSDEKCSQCEDNLFHGMTCNLTCDSACINKTSMDVKRKSMVAIVIKIVLLNVKPVEIPRFV